MKVFAQAKTGRRKERRRDELVASRGDCETKLSVGEAEVTAKNLELAKALSESRVRLKEQSRQVQKLSHKNYHLASHCRQLHRQVARLRKELAIQRVVSREAGSPGLSPQTSQPVSHVTKERQSQVQIHLSLSPDAVQKSADGQSTQLTKATDTSFNSTLSSRAFLGFARPTKNRSPTRSLRKLPTLSEEEKYSNQANTSAEGQVGNEREPVEECLDAVGEEEKKEEIFSTLPHASSSEHAQGSPLPQQLNSQQQHSSGEDKPENERLHRILRMYQEATSNPHGVRAIKPSPPKVRSMQEPSSHFAKLLELWEDKKPLQDEEQETKTDDDNKNIDALWPACDHRPPYLPSLTHVNEEAETLDLDCDKCALLADRYEKSWNIEIDGVDVDRIQPQTVEEARGNSQDVCLLSFPSESHGYAARCRRKARIGLCMLPADGDDPPSPTTVAI